MFINSLHSGGLASPSDYDRMLELRTADVGVASVCGDRNTDSNIFIAVDTVSSEAGTYKFTATEYCRLLTIVFGY